MYVSLNASRTFKLSYTSWGALLRTDYQLKVTDEEKGTARGGAVGRRVTFQGQRLQQQPEQPRAGWAPKLPSASNGHFLPPRPQSLSLLFLLFHTLQVLPLTFNEEVKNKIKIKKATHCLNPSVSLFSPLKGDRIDPSSPVVRKTGRTWEPRGVSPVCGHGGMSGQWPHPLLMTRPLLLSPVTVPGRKKSF